MLQDAAAIGAALRNKKVVVSVSPPWFFLHDRTPEFYAPNYSRLHLSALVRLYSARTDAHVGVPRGA
jgi:poly-D-alanine transfer protein DltD